MTIISQACRYLVVIETNIYTETKKRINKL